MCKYKIYVSSDAKQDLLSIRSYIDKVCQSSVTSQKLMVSIDKAIFSLDSAFIRKFPPNLRKFKI